MTPSSTSDQTTLSYSQQQKLRVILWLGGLTLACLLSLALSLLTGSINVSATDLWQLVLFQLDLAPEPANTLSATVITELRLPRALSALV
ncbi:MAG: hypothetical protein R3204_02300, partial [Oceanospirillum sp.]|nr:hypothetical protein [Oceanospirillum sp.]